MFTIITQQHNQRQRRNNTSRRSGCRSRRRSSMLLYTLSMAGLWCWLAFIRQEALAINSVLNINDTFPYLRNQTTGQITEPRDYMDFENIYAPSERYRREQTAQGRNYHLLKAFDFANYFQTDYWHYSSEEDLRLSAYPVANEDRCAQQLDWLERQLNKSESLFQAGEQHVNLMTFVDSFGRPEASTYTGHGYWMGSYYECTRAAIDMAKFEQEQAIAAAKNNNNRTSQQSTGSLPTVSSTDQLLSSTTTKLKSRYCIGKARDVDWPSEKEDNYVPGISYKVGLCLPETCETLSIRRHRAQIERLMLFNMPAYMRSRIYLKDMYCLPDSRSPIRALKPASRVFLTICIAWLLALAVATTVYSCHKRDLRNIIIAERAHRHLERISDQVEAKLKQQAQLNHYVVACQAPPSSPPLSPSAAAAAQARAMLQPPTVATNGSPHHHHHHQLLIIKPSSHPAAATAVRLLAAGDQSDSQSNSSFRSNASSSLTAWLTDSPLTIRILQALSVKENIREFQQPPLLLRSPGANEKLRINLNALDSIKCLCCVMVIFGHIVFIHMQHLSNIQHTIEISYELGPRFLIAFFNFVDTFFIISGMLTAYFIFKRFNKRTFGRPLVWLYISLLRFVRLSPVYLLVFWFAKTLTVHLTDGPIWDYGTDKQSIKGLCINDHWWKSILYLGNVGTMQPLCILPAWSIIVDAQYSLIVPPILFLLLRHKRLGYIGLLVAVVVSTANMSFQLASQTAVKTSDMAKIRLHVYPLISRFAAEFYNTAWNRIGPVAIGILGGHCLHLYDIGKTRRWPWFMRGTAFKFVLFMHLFIFVLPTIGRFTDSPDSNSGDQETDMTVFVLSNATIKPIWSIINTIFLLRLVTDLRLSSTLARIMSHNIWHCLGKLCFASYLIHYEVILVLLKSRQEGLVDPNWPNVGREFSFAFLISTVLAYFIYILFEAPVNKLITLVFVKPNYTENGGGGGGSGSSSSSNKERGQIMEDAKQETTEETKENLRQQHFNGSNSNSSLDLQAEEDDDSMVCKKSCSSFRSDDLDRDHHNSHPHPHSELSFDVAATTAATTTTTTRTRQQQLPPLQHLSQQQYQAVPMSPLVTGYTAAAAAAAAGQQQGAPVEPIDVRIQ